MAATASKKQHEGQLIVDLIWDELEREGLDLPNVPVKDVVKRGIRRITENGRRREQRQKNRR